MIFHPEFQLSRVFVNFRFTISENYLIAITVLHVSVFCVFGQFFHNCTCFVITQVAISFVYVIVVSMVTEPGAGNSWSAAGER